MVMISKKTTFLADTLPEKHFYSESSHSWKSDQSLHLDLHYLAISYLAHAIMLCRVC